MKKLHLIVTFCTALLLFVNVSAKIRKDKHRKKFPSKLPEEQNTDLCAIEGNDIPFHCFCSDGTETSNATKVKCWVINGLNQEHKLWSLFSTQPEIAELNLMTTQMGKLKFIPTKGLQYLKKLQTLTVVYGGIDSIQSYAFANLTTLHEMLLARNKIAKLSDYAFAHLTNLTTLDLDDNKISELRKDVFVDLPKLRRLFLKQNNLSNLQKEAFGNLRHLHELELSSNSIIALTEDAFVGLGELRKLGLSSNNITKIEDLTFARLPMLEELDLEFNQIESISGRGFSGLAHLFRLNLSHNKLKHLQSTLLEGLASIFNFDLRHNLLESLTHDTIKPVLKNFYNDSSYLYLSENQFECDCRLIWLYTLKNETNNQPIRDALDELTCHLEINGSHIPSTTPFSTKSQTINKTLLQNDDVFLNPLNAGNSDDEYDEEAYYYDDYYQQEDSDHNSVRMVDPSDPSLRYLFHIPPAELPCTENAQADMKLPRYATEPIFAEHSSSTRYSSIISLTLFMLILVT